MRLFIAADFNELKGYFIELQKLLPKNAKLSLTRTFHITLKFLGEVQPDKVEEIISKLKAIKFQQFTVFLDSIGIFPTEDYIRVVWVGIKPEDKILELWLSSSKYAEDKKNFEAIIDEELRKMLLEELFAKKDSAIFWFMNEQPMLLSGKTPYEYTQTYGLREIKRYVNGINYGNCC